MDEAALADRQVGGPRRLLSRHILRLWIGLSWLVLLVAAAVWQFWLGYDYSSNDTTNTHLRLARGASYALLVLLAVLWLPVMKQLLSWLRNSPLGRWLPLDSNRRLHRLIGYAVVVLAVLHASQYLFYYNTLESEFSAILLGDDSDLVRSMQTTMYEFVSEDEAIDDVEAWIADGAGRAQYEAVVRPLLREDCTKCHSTDSTQTWAMPDMPLSDYQQVTAWTESGLYSKQFRVNISGLIMLALIVVIGISALGPVRRRVFHHFQWLHQLGYLFAALLILHLPASLTWLQLPLAILAIELLFSHYRSLYRNCEARVSDVGGDILRLAVKRPSNFDNRAGHYVQIRVRKLARLEWHPYSLTGERGNTEELVLKVRCNGDWARRLLALHDAPLHVDMRGPYASPAALANDNNNWLLMAAGIGITPFLSLLCSRSRDPATRGEVHLVWVLREPHLLDWLQPLIEPIGRCLKMRFYWHLYLSGDSPEGQEPAWLSELPDNLLVRVHHGRPDWFRLVTGVAEQTDSPDCFVCGPPHFSRTAALACRLQRWKVTREEF